MKLNYKRTILVGFAFFLICAFWQAYDNTVPLILTNKFGMSQTWSGVIMAMDNVLALFLLPLFGHISDKFTHPRGRRTPFIVVGTLIAAVALMALLLIILLSMATFRSPAVALMPDVTPKPLRSKANAVINLMGSAGGIIVLALGMVFATASVSNSMMSYTGYFGVIAALMLAALVVFMLTVREPEWAREMQAQSVAAGIEDAEEADHPNEGRKLSADEVKSLLLILLSIVLWFFGYNAVTSKYSVYASNILHKDYNLTLIIAQAAAIAAYLPVGFIALAGIAWATINVNSFPMVVELASGGDVGKYTGFYYTASMAAQVATPMVSGLLMDKFGMHVLFPYAAVFTALAFVTMLFVKHGDSREMPKQTAAAGTEDAGAIDNTVEELTND